MHKSPDIFLFKAFIAAVAHYKICTTIFAITSRFSQNFYCHNFIFAAAALVFVTIKIRGLLKFPRQCALCPDQCGCKILMRAYGFGKDFEIQCILYGKCQNPDCAVHIAVKTALTRTFFNMFCRLDYAPRCKH